MTITCVSPPELEDKQLLAYLDDPDANSEIALHIMRCTYCREKAGVLERFQKRLTNRLYRITCPSPMELGEYHLRMLASSQMLVVRQHLTECPHCSSEIAELEEFLGQEVSVFGKAKRLIARLLGAGSAPGERGLDLAPGTLRGESKGPLTFEAEGMIVTLELQPAADGQISILGQVAADDQDQWTGAEVRIYQAGALRVTVSVDDLGAFRWDEARPGPTRITITSLDGIEVLLPDTNLEV